MCVAVLLDPRLLSSLVPLRMKSRAFVEKELYYLRLLALHTGWVLRPKRLWPLRVEDREGTGTRGEPSIANRFIKFPLRWLCSQFIPSMKETLYGIRAHTEQGGSSLTHTHKHTRTHTHSVHSPHLR